jgi:hypothetical protein
MATVRRNLGIAPITTVTSLGRTINERAVYKDWMAIRADRYRSSVCPTSPASIAAGDNIGAACAIASIAAGNRTIAENTVFDR